MKFFKILGVLIGIGTLASYHQLSIAQTRRDFFCGAASYQSEVIPTTFARTERGNEIPIVYWISHYFDATGSTPQSRCEEISNKLQAVYDHGLLKPENFTHDVINELNVICITLTLGDSAINEGCNQESIILVTLPPDVDPLQVLGELTNFSGVPLRLNDIITFRNGRAYIDFEIFLDLLESQV
jgi:hypothetical protein